jgi:hypothetical protein
MGLFFRDITNMEDLARRLSERSILLKFDPTRRNTKDLRGNRLTSFGIKLLSE